MPAGVETVVDGGFATIDFIDVSLRGPALAKLLEVGGPGTIQTITREGPRRKYRVAEGNAREAGLLDTPVDTTAAGDTGFAADLADASSQGARPEQPTVKGQAYVGTTPSEDVLGGTSVETSLASGSGTGESVAPPHADVIERVKKAPAKRAAAKKAQPKTAEE